jgi:hypothetical protein
VFEEPDFNEPDNDEPDFTDNTVDLTERPDWLPVNFDTPEALVQSYKEANAKLTQSSQQASQARREADEYRSRLEAVQESKQRDPQARILALQRFADQAAQRALTGRFNQPRSVTPDSPDLLALSVTQNAAAQFPDWEEKKGRVMTVLRDNEHLIPRDLSPPDVERGVRLAYDLVSAEERGARTHAEESRSLKLRAQTLRGAAGRLPAPDDDEQHFERMKAAHRTGWAGSRG